MKHRLERRLGFGHLKFITCSCYRRRPFLGTHQARNLFVKILSEVRDRYDSALLGYVVMPEHIHLLISEPNIGSPTTVMQVLKQRVSPVLRQRRRSRTPVGQMRLWHDPPVKRHPRFWQHRFYDFNVWSFRNKERENELHALQSREARVGRAPEGVALEQLSFLFDWGSRFVRAQSGMEAATKRARS